MAANSTVKEHDCGDRRKDLYARIDKLKTDIDTMKGAILFAKWLIPIMIVFLGAFLKLQVDSLRKEIIQITDRSKAADGSKAQEKLSSTNP